MYYVLSNTSVITYISHGKSYVLGVSIVNELSEGGVQSGVEDEVEEDIQDTFRF